jgi:hypothetical protein
VLGTLTAVIGPIEKDRPFGADIERLATATWPSP